MEYVTVDELRNELGDDLDGVSDEVILSSLDNLSDALENLLGHGFGRVARVWSDQAQQARVSTVGVEIGGDTYLFADYPTIGELEDEVAASGHDYYFQRLPTVSPDLPSNLLKPMALRDVGPGYGYRATIDSVALREVKTGDYKTHLFLMLDIRSITSITENGLVVKATTYDFTRNYVRRGVCGNTCSGVWSGRYMNGIVVIYRPLYWGMIPGEAKRELIKAFKDEKSSGNFSAESFLDYSYRKAETPSSPIITQASASSLRRYARKVMIR